MTIRGEMLDRAKAVVDQDRPSQYGGPEQSFEQIAMLWSAYLNQSMSSNDVALMMALVKIARLRMNQAHADSWIDLAGYAACGAEINDIGLQ